MVVAAAAALLPQNAPIAFLAVCTSLTMTSLQILQSPNLLELKKKFSEQSKSETTDEEQEQVSASWKRAQCSVDIKRNRVTAIG